MRNRWFLLIWIQSILCGFFSLKASKFKVGEANCQNGSDSLPMVFAGDRADLVYRQMRLQASAAFQLRQLPSSPLEWTAYRSDLRKKVVEKAGIQFFHDLPLNYRETGSLQRTGFSVRNILFQTRPGVFATANLYVPDGKGPFPAVLTMHGHWPNGKTNPIFQSIGQSLALNGYVCLIIDTWGSGERTSVHGTDEYHGSNLGASVLNLGETLLGVQVSDNMRGVDLLCSLPYVDASRIGATGASGGGNQTMWLSAIDERVKAAMPVVSVGTFDSYIMEDNCVCEVLPDGLTFTEESGILALTAPRALKICNVQKDVNPTFVPAEMLRSYKNLLPVYNMLGAGGKVTYSLFDEEHTYSAAMRGHLLGWMDLHLKGTGNGAAKTEVPFEPIGEEKLMVFPAGKRDASVETIRAYCARKGRELRKRSMEQATSAHGKRQRLSEILSVGKGTAIKEIHSFHAVAGWERLALETVEGKLIPALLRMPPGKLSQYVIVLNPRGKYAVDTSLINTLARQGKGILIPDLWGTGEASSAYADAYDAPLVPFHTLSRARQWLGGSVIGEWIGELDLMIRYLKKLDPKAEITLDGTREGGLAALFYAALNNPVAGIVLRESPVSYLFDDTGNVDFFSMATQLTGFLNWGDVSLAAALTNARIRFINPLTMAGRPLSNDEFIQYRQEFATLRKRYGRKGAVEFLMGK